MLRYTLAIFLTCDDLLAILLPCVLLVSRYFVRNSILNVSANNNIERPTIENRYYIHIIFLLPCTVPIPIQYMYMYNIIYYILYIDIGIILPTFKFTHFQCAVKPKYNIYIICRMVIWMRMRSLYGEVSRE